MLQDGAAECVEFVSEDGHVVSAVIQQRPDIADGFPKIESAVNSGFGGVLPDEFFWRKDRYKFAIIAKRNNRVEFRCNVTCRGGQNPANSVHRIRNGVLDI